MLKLERAVLVQSLVVRFARYLRMFSWLTMAFISIVRCPAVPAWSLVIECA